jgi:hypothetical protein
MKRLLSFLILVLLVSLLIGCSGGNGVTPSLEAEKFVGFWVNEDEDNGGITKIDITKAGDTILVHMWGKCHPEDCDWGVSTTDVSDAADGILNITWDFDFAVETQELYVLSDGRLNVVTFVDYFEDDIFGRIDFEYTEYFIKES